LAGSCDGNQYNDVKDSSKITGSSGTDNCNGCFIDSTEESNFVYTYTTSTGVVYEEPKEFTGTCTCGYYIEDCCVTVVPSQTTDTESESSIVDGTFTTFDGVQYELDTRGEFEFYNSSETDVYIRMTPCGLQDVCLTQVQVSTETASVVVHAPYTNTSDAVVFGDDGQEIDFTNAITTTLDENTSITKSDDNEFVVTNAGDNTETTITVNSEGTLNVVVTSLINSCSNDVSGLAGSCDDNLNNELTTGNGDYIDPTSASSEDITNVADAFNVGGSSDSESPDGGSSGTDNTNFVYNYTDDSGTTYTEPETILSSCPPGFFGADCSLVLEDESTNSETHGVATVNEDGTITTFDDVTYDVTITGEFTFANTSDGVVSVKLVPCGDTVCVTQVSVETDKGAVVVHVPYVNTSDPVIFDQDGDSVNIAPGYSVYVGDIAVSQLNSETFVVKDQTGNEVTITIIPPQDGSIDETTGEPGVNTGGTHTLKVNVTVENDGCKSLTNSLSGSCDGNVNNEFQDVNDNDVPVGMIDEDTLNVVADHNSVNANESNFVYTYTDSDGEVYTEPQTFESKCVCDFYLDSCCISVTTPSDDGSLSTTSINGENSTLTTFDGLSFSLGDGGEFDFVDVSDMNVSVKTETCSTGTCVTQVLVQTGDGNIVVVAPVDEEGNLIGEGDVVVSSGGETTSSVDTLTSNTVGNTTMEQNEDGDLIITDSDDTEITIRVSENGGLDISVSVDKTNCADMTGLTGSCDGDIDNDVVIDGEPVSVADITSGVLSENIN
ncbi:unnamed protein product, partial [Owenia fusiformis]